MADLLIKEQLVFFGLYDVSAFSGGVEGDGIVCAVDIPEGYLGQSATVVRYAYHHMVTPLPSCIDDTVLQV